MTMTAVTASARTHVLQIVGNAIVGGMENYVVRLVERLPRERYARLGARAFREPASPTGCAASAPTSSSRR